MSRPRVLCLFALAIVAMLSSGCAAAGTAMAASAVIKAAKASFSKASINALDSAKAGAQIEVARAQTDPTYFNERTDQIGKFLKTTDNGARPNSEGHSREKRPTIKIHRPKNPNPNVIDVYPVN